jgi:carboxymethylenebutenolidase
MRTETLTIDTADGECTTEVFSPDGSGPFPAVIVYMDAAGVRPAMREITERIAAARHWATLLPLFRETLQAAT